MNKLAIKGGGKVRTKKFPASVAFGEEEKKAASRVIDSGLLSGYLATWGKNFYGGEEVKRFEKEWAKFFGVKHAIAVNSATSGLYCAVGALGVGPGDEVIVSPYSMSASATAPLVYGAIPVFADIEKDYFCLSPESIEQKITKLTKAIIVVDIFGQPYDVKKINAIARKHRLFVIEDAAQAPGAKYKGHFAGTLGNIGVYSLNYHKHIHTGEGGMVVTNNDDLAENVRLIRNHAEAVLEKKNHKTLVNMVGFNYRMTEITAAIGRVQLKKLPSLLRKRQKNIEYLSKELSKIPCLEPVGARANTKHSYYMQIIKYKPETTGLHRDVFIEAVKAELQPIKLRESEGIKIGAGYVKPLYLLPIYQKRIAQGKSGFPWAKPFYKGSVDYSPGVCPIVEKMHNDIVITNEIIKPPLTKRDLNDVVAAFKKVWKNREQLLKHGKR